MQLGSCRLALEVEDFAGLDVAVSYLLDLKRPICRDAVLHPQTDGFAAHLELLCDVGVAAESLA